MDKFEIRRLRELPILSVAQRLGIEVRGGKYCRCPSPQHDDHTPSCSFRLDGTPQRWKCWSCGRGGDVIALCQEVLGLGFPEACRWLADECNVIISEAKAVERSKKTVVEADLPYLRTLVEHPVLTPLARRFLLEERRLDERVVRWIGLSSIDRRVPMRRVGECGWFNAPSLLIPYWDVERRELLSLQARFLGPKGSTYRNGKELPRFQYPSGNRPTLFNLPILRRLQDGDDLYLAEGPTDTMALLSAGMKAIGVPSATMLSRDHVELLRATLPEGTRLHAWPDRDEAGEKLFAELVRMADTLGRPLVRHDLPEGCKDFGEWWKRAR